MIERFTGPRIRRVSERGLRWLTALEGGVKLRAYLDSREVPTVGVGQTTMIAPGGERRVTLADKFPDERTAIDSFRKRLARDEVALDAVTRDSITQQEFDAFASARYNIGPAFDTADFLDLFNSGAPIKIVADSLRANWHRGGKAHSLDSRRICEADLLCFGVYHNQGGRDIR